MAGLGLTRSHPLFGRTSWAIFLIGLSMYLPMYAVQPLLVPIGAEFATSAGQTTWVMGATSAGIAATVIPMGAVSARLGRRRLMIAGLILVIGSGLATAFMQHWPALLGVRVLTGIGTAAIIVSAMAWVAEQSHPLTIAVLGGFYVSGTSVGAMLSRLSASYVAEFTNWRLGVGLTALLAAVLGLVAHLMLPATQASTPPAIGRSRQRVTTSFLARVYLIGGLNMALFTGLFTAIPFRIAAPPFNAGLALTGSLYLTYLGGTVSSAITGRLVDRLRFRVVLAAGSIMLIVAVAVTWVPNLLIVTLGLLLAAVGFFLVHAVANSLAPRFASLASASSARYSLAYYVGATAGAGGFGALWELGGWTLVSLVAALLAATAAAVALSLGVPRAVE